MPGCVYNHPHVPWRIVGPLTICDGERTCGYCKGPEATIAYADAANLRKHVYHSHTDGGSRDQRSVEVLMYRPWIHAAGGKTPEGEQSHDDHAHNMRHRAKGGRVKDLTGTTSAEGAAPSAERTTFAGVHDARAAGQPTEPAKPKKWMSEAGKASHRRRMAEVNKKAREARERKEAEGAEEVAEQAKPANGERTN
ncbi:hypothetical protein KC332_g5270 [Hortaea werneckii]|uniref:Uncharacterized protein n=2 Tax=Hortaea werneckii TaxID=91943 RepID=A0A3M7IDH5_HORWE|nr:hypothetical protein KC358_g11453 [Hortaea werneckii]OTA26408.1 hypothetical protein BTJ68_10576 [Hortaea werneckii EXF-2000]KAI6827279.1 hypothetical protein KC342_g10108 [Hortaea werneckii]KAI6827460.1 hypothetical protein KC350_g8282 [Hortaea werneckii]KAI6938217.1 hypothetical protein KC341_g5038 [Hortaea werneckii]